MRVPNELLREHVTIEDHAGHGALGPLYSAPRTVRASVQETYRLVTTSTGAIVTVDTLTIIRPEDGPVLVESRLTARGTLYRVVKCYAMPDERRPYYYNLLLTRFASLGGGSGPGPGSGSGSGS